MSYDSVIFENDVKDIYPSIREVLLDYTTDKLLKGKAVESAHTSQLLMYMINKQKKPWNGRGCQKSLSEAE